MAARRLRLLFAFELVIYAALIAALHARAGLSLAVLLICLPIAMLTIRGLLVLGTFGITAVVGPSPALSPRQWIEMIARELAAFIRFQWLIATHAKNDVPRAASNGPLVVLLHGILCNGAIWRPVVTTLGARSGCSIHTPDIEPDAVTLGEQARTFSAWLKQLVAAHPHKSILIVAHSLGGLIARLSLQADEHPNIRLICVGTPHEGSVCVRVLRSQIGRDLRIGSAALAALRLDAAKIVNIHSPHDNLVIPARGSVLPGADNRAIPGCGHISLVYSKTVADIVCDELARMQSPGAGSGFT